MSKTNYSKMSRKTEDVVEPVIWVDLATEPDVTVEEEVVLTKPKIGVVANCTKLNVRKNPNVNANIITTIDKGVEVEIDETFNNKEFYKVTVSSVNGFCMKKFIELK